MSKVRRKGNGQFAKGSSGNGAGRPVKYDIPASPASRRKIILGVADEEIEATVGGRKRKMSLYEANVRALALAGARNNRMAAQTFINMVQREGEIEVMRSVMSHQMSKYVEGLERDSAKLAEISQVKRHGVVQVPVPDLNDWDPHRAMDDYINIAKASGKPMPGTGGAIISAGDDDDDEGG